MKFKKYSKCLSNKRKQCRFLPLLLIFLFFFSACFESKEASLAPLSAAEISGERLWERITKEDPFQGYPAWPGYDGLQSGQAPHSRFHRIYINQILAQALPIANRMAPDGAMIIKESYGPDRQVSGYYTMTKVSTYNPDAGDWFWAVFGIDGNVEVEGKPRMCIDCHASSDSDFVLLHRLDFDAEQ